MSPRRNRRQRNRRRPPELEPQAERLNTQSLALALVIRGRASPAILGPIKRAWIDRRSA